MSAVNGANVTDSNGVYVESGMIRAMVRMLVAVGFAAFTVLFIILPSGLFDNFGSPESAFAARLRMGESWQSVVLGGAVLAGVTLIATWALYHGLRKLEPILDANAIAEAHFLDTLDSGKVDLAIAIAAALSLFLELALIRWQSSVLEFLAFYKNFSLLAGEQRLGQDRYAGQHRTPLGRPSS